MLKNNLSNRLTTDDTVLLDSGEIKRRRDAANKRKREEKSKEAGFSRLKIYLGRDTYETLAEIYEDQRGNALNVDGRKDIDSLSQVISFCINKVYEQMYMDKKDRGVIKALAAKNARSQELYDLHQAATFLQSNGLSYTEIKNKLNKSGRRPPNMIPGFAPYNRSPVWTVQQVKDVLDFEILNADLSNLNG
ncbi:conserved hypothetical protein [Enterobacterales bacterium 8AC]|nr:conserved hypothetical protein [Enterobacterales bacterium 8AC]